jgi:predicted DNA-binding WGR domain protein
MSYPVEIANINLESSDGKRSNKFYNLICVVGADGKSALVKRYGKNDGRLGEIIIVTGDQAKVEKEFESMLSSKTRKGYAIKSNTTKRCNDERELRMGLGPALWPKLPGSMLDHLDLGIDTSQRRELEQPRFAENGTYLGEQKPRSHTREEIEAAKRAEEAQHLAEQAATYRQNKNFGRF